MTVEDELADRLKYRVESSDLGRCYYNHRGELHREGAPAVEYANGVQMWYLNGNLHRKDGPAVIYANGYREWWVNGKLHQVAGPAVIPTNGEKE